MYGTATHIKTKQQQMKHRTHNPGLRYGNTYHVVKCVCVCVLQPKNFVMIVVSFSPFLSISLHHTKIATQIGTYRLFSF